MRGEQAAFLHAMAEHTRLGWPGCPLPNTGAQALNGEGPTAHSLQQRGTPLTAFPVVDGKEKEVLLARIEELERIQLLERDADAAAPPPLPLGSESHQLTEAACCRPAQRL